MRGNTDKGVRGAVEDIFATRYYYAGHRGRAGSVLCVHPPLERFGRCCAEGCEEQAVWEVRAGLSLYPYCHVHAVEHDPCVRRHYRAARPRWLALSRATPK